MTTPLHSLFSEWRNDLFRIEKQIELLVTNDFNDARKQWLLWFVENRDQPHIADALPLRSSWDEPSGMLTMLRQAYEAIEHQAFTVISDPNVNRTWIEWVEPSNKIELDRCYRQRMGRNKHLQVTYHQDLQRFVREIGMFKKMRANNALNKPLKDDIILPCTNDSELLSLTNSARR